jgi:hypothetical protein
MSPVAATSSSTFCGNVDPIRIGAGCMERIDRVLHDAIARSDLAQRLAHLLCLFGVVSQEHRHVSKRCTEEYRRGVSRRRLG